MDYEKTKLPGQLGFKIISSMQLGAGKAIYFRAKADEGKNSYFYLHIPDESKAEATYCFMLNENGNLSNIEIQETILPEKQKSIQPFAHHQPKKFPSP